MNVVMTAHATSVGGRAGHVQSDDAVISLDLVSQDSAKKGSNPEQLFAAGYAACFGSALDAVATSKELETGEIAVRADVSLNQSEAGFFISVVLHVTFATLVGDAAHDLVHAAHQVCPYSKATRNNVEVTFTVNEAPLAMAA